MKNPPVRPPGFALRILRWFCKPTYLEAIEGDLFELFERQSLHQPALAKWKFLFNVIRFFRWQYLKDLEDVQPKSSIGMLKSYFKVSLRSMAKNKAQSILNILGLAVGITSCLLILMHVKHQLKYDRHIDDVESIYRVTINDGGRYTPARLVKQMREDYPEVMNGVRISSSFELVFEQKGKFIKQGGGLLADSTFFEVFPTVFLRGNSRSALNGPKNIVLTESLAKKIFQDSDPLGEVITTDWDSYTVTAIVADPPRTTTIPYQYVISIPWESWATTGSWTGNNFYSYLKLHPGVDPRQLEVKFPDFVERYVGPELLEFHAKYSSFEDYLADGNRHFFGLAPMKDIHLHYPQLSLGVPGDYKNLVIFVLISIFILVIACINYINMATARSSIRAKEIGMRKVMGSVKSLIAQQFMVESFLITLSAILIGMTLAILLLPYFNQVSQGDYQIADLINLENAGWFMLILAVATLLSGSYPAIYLASFKPIAALRGEMVKSGSSRIRSGLVIFQYAISLFLLIATFIVFEQVSLMNARKLGLDANQVYVISGAEKIADRYQAFKDQLIASSGIENIGISNAFPSQPLADWNYQSVDENPVTIAPYNIFVTHEMMNIWGLNLKSGRFFIPELTTDTTKIVVNDFLVQRMGWEEPIGQILSRGSGEDFQVIGVVENFATGSAKRGEAPVVLRYATPGEIVNYGQDYLMIKITGDVPQALEVIETAWDEFTPGYPMDGVFMNDSFQRLYEAEKRFGWLFSGFSIVAVIIACIGLFTLSSFTLERKRKEIALRKVLGARVEQLFFSISKDFGKLIFTGAIFAVPFAFYLGSSWLEEYVERIRIGPLIFLVPLGLILMISFLTIFYQTYRTAEDNPVNALKEE